MKDIWKSGERIMFSVKFELVTLDMLKRDLELGSVEGIAAITMRRSLGLPDANNCCFSREGIQFSDLSANEVSGWEEFSRNSYPTFKVPVELLRAGEAIEETMNENGVFSLVRKTSQVLRVASSLSHDRVLELIRDVKSLGEKIRLEKKLQEVCKKNEDLEKEKVQLARELETCRTQSRDMETNLRAQIDGLTGLIREAVEDIRNSRQFVHSKKLAALRERLEKALPPENDCDK